MPVEKTGPPVRTAIVTVVAWHAPWSPQVQPDAHRRVRIGIRIDIGRRHDRSSNGRLRQLLLKLSRGRNLSVHLTFQLSDQILLRLNPTFELRDLLLLTLDEGVQTASLCLICIV